MHIHVSAKHLPKHLGEFEYRSNMRAVPHLMLDRMMHSFELSGLPETIAFTRCAKWLLSGFMDLLKAFGSVE
jgi:hypothetical protein